MHCIEHTQVKTIKSKQYKKNSFHHAELKYHIYMTCAVETKLISDMIKRNLTSIAFNKLIINV